MFTGIVREIGVVVELKQEGEILHYAVSFAHHNLERGASVSVDGVCQTVVRIEGDKVWFDAIEETVRRTTFATLLLGQKVNIEQAAKFGDEIGGHLLSGHIYGTAQIDSIEGNIYAFSIPKAFGKYLFSKGYISIDGISLTVVEVQKTLFTVHLIPETLARTTLGKKRVGDRVNLEFDALTQAAVESVERLMKERC